ncbi:hypothetical protein RHMOL_Rhmol13G0116400 [Rhododendron molle]|uniref:Uncharacterized protein n=1 Tax=Rhododendron molle TaxID=49168 RepID=A0ACC0L5J3_RHOML|nr:hypothetical protein RHMOL_Rhmol13G0116400 [Rhododendron molle]
MFGRHIAALARAKEYRITVEDRLHSDTNERQSRSPKRLLSTKKLELQQKTFKHHPLLSDAPDSNHR